MTRIVGSFCGRWVVGRVSLISVSRVGAIDLSRIFLDHLVALELHRRREEAILDRPRVDRHDHSADLRVARKRLQLRADALEDEIVYGLAVERARGGIELFGDLAPLIRIEDR